MSFSNQSRKRRGPSASSVAAGCLGRGQRGPSGQLSRRWRSRKRLRGPSGQLRRSWRSRKNCGARGVATLLQFLVHKKKSKKVKDKKCFCWTFWYKDNTKGLTVFYMTSSSLKNFSKFGKFVTYGHLQRNLETVACLYTKISFSDGL